jgi:DNA-binding CsgD family transcriptional regulator
MPSPVSQVFCAVLDQLGAGVVVMSEEGKILHTNDAVQKMIAEGWPVRISNGHLQCEDRRATDTLYRALRYVADEAQALNADKLCLDISLAHASSSRGAAIGSLKPVLLDDGKGEMKIFIVLYVTHTGAHNQCRLSAIADCFDLTPAETRTLEQFVQGGSLTEVAAALRISENTVKTHLQNIFAKTGTSRQMQLVRLVQALLPPFRAELVKKFILKPNERRRNSARGQGAGVRMPVSYN